MEYLPLPNVDHTHTPRHNNNENRTTMTRSQDQCRLAGQSVVKLRCFIHTLVWGRDKDPCHTYLVRSQCRRHCPVDEKEDERQDDSLVRGHGWWYYKCIFPLVAHVVAL